VNITRRNFLQASAGAAALASWPFRARAGPNDTLRIAIAGVRGRGAEHAGYFSAMKDVEIAALCDVDENVAGKALKIIENAGGRKPALHQDFRKVLDDKAIDAVVIATTNHTHSLFTIWACQAGKHVYVEKPVSHNLWEGCRMVEAARKYDRVVQTGTQTRSREAVRKAVDFLRAGKLGKIKVGRGIVYRKREGIGRKPDGPVPAGVDYNLWLGPAPERPFNPNRFHYEWHWNWDFGGGDLANNGIHALDVVRWGMGLESLPRRVLSVGGRYLWDDDGQTPNSQIAWLDYGDRSMICEVRNLKSEPYMGGANVVFHGEKGTLTVGKEVVALDPKGERIEVFTGAEGDHYRNFVEAARSGKRSGLAADVQEGHLSSSLCHLGNISWRLGEEQPLDARDDPFGECAAGNETFCRLRAHLKENGVNLTKTRVRVGKLLSFDPATCRFAEAEANGLLAREYRKPFVVPDKV
jgi:predicted dehydrogenase